LQIRFHAFAAALALAPCAASADALGDARDAFLAAWEAAPLTVGRAIFAREPAAAYGLVRERRSNVFAVNETMYVYVEPLGYGWKPQGPEFLFGVHIGLRILTQAGDQLFEDADFLELTARSRARPTEFYGNFSMNFAKIQPGDYVLELILRDVASDETASVQMPIVVQ
jgi:hypothetical protein